VVYANDAKTLLAGVPAEVIEQHGAVSVEVAEALADGARSAVRADVGVGITGIAGPDGGTEEKPVGTVCISVAGPEGLRMTRRLHIPGDRAEVRDRSTTVAMHMIRLLILGQQD
jgi:nicotinamide-nucleotide amidase